MLSNTNNTATNNTAIATPVPSKEAHHDSIGNVHGLRTPGLLGKWPLIGLLMVLLGSILFGVLAFDVQTHSALLQTDTQISDAFHTVALQSSPFLRGVMIFGFYLGEHGILLIGGVVLLYFYHKRFWPEVSMVVIGGLGEALIWFTLTRYYSRARPVFDTPFWTQTPGPGFPSGHTFTAVLLFGLLAYLFVPKISSYFGKIVVIVVTVLILLFIGLSRVFTGDHYPIDILAGYALGIFWAGAVFTSVELITKGRIVNSPSEKAKGG